MGGRKVTDEPVTCHKPNPAIRPPSRQTDAEYPRRSPITAAVGPIVVSAHVCNSRYPSGDRRGDPGTVPDHQSNSECSQKHVVYAQCPRSSVGR